MGSAVGVGHTRYDLATQLLLPGMTGVTDNLSILIDVTRSTHDEREIVSCNLYDSI